MNEQRSAPAPVAVTERAALRIAAVLRDEPAGAMFRVSVNGGGCSGFQYAFDIAKDRSDDDLVVEQSGAVVLVDPVSLDFLRGAKVDYVDDLMGQSFKIINPNAASSCGCGVSFSI